MLSYLLTNSITRSLNTRNIKVEDVKTDNKKSSRVETEFIVETESTNGDDNSPYTIKSTIDLAESESARNREQNTQTGSRPV